MNPNKGFWQPSAPGSHNTRAKAFTLIELITVITLMGILFTLAAPSVLSSMEKVRGRRCSASLLLLENAKDAYLLDHPGQAITSANSLLPYLRNGMPQCPSGGAYGNLAELLAPCTCTLNSQTAAAEHDGIHDLGL